MCRFALYMGPEISLGSLVIDPSHSIIHQSFRSREREEPLNGDGFGIAWYVPDIRPEPVVFKDISPAWNNINLLSLSGVMRSQCIFAHVRAATLGLPVSQLNCHPFSWQKFVFMHNGQVGAFGKICRKLRRRLSDESYAWIQGTTDSELVFALFIDAWQALPEEDPVDRIAQALIKVIGVVETERSKTDANQESLLNLAVSDGTRAVVTRFSSSGKDSNTLYVHRGSSYSCENGVCYMEPGGNEAVIVASEPLSEDLGWTAVPENHLVMIDNNRRIVFRSIEP